MRRGAFPCVIEKGTKTYAAYQRTHISERHRHRWEFNNAYLDAFRNAGMIAAGINPESGLVEIIELKDHRWFIGVQFHPELRSTVENPHPLFVDFVRHCMQKEG
jgi:CTP synthase